MAGQWIKNGVYASDTIEIDGKMVSNPTDEMLKAAGYEQYQPTDEEKLEAAKEAKLKEITAYDESDAVNGFEVAGMTLWFDPDTRVAIEKGVRNCQTVGRESYEAWLDALGTTVSVPCDTALQMLAQIEVYALDCMNTTSKHKAAVKALATVDEVAAYDYKSGYPDKLTFSL